MAGTSAVALPAPLGTAMMGYGARQGVAESVHDPLHARALYLAGPGPGAEGRGEALLVECDLCLILPAQALEIRRAIHARSGVPVESIVVGCIHTHSGPDTGLFEALTGQAPPPHLSAVFEAVVEAGCHAVQEAAPAQLGVGRAQARIGRNRTRPDGPLDPEVLVVRVDAREPSGSGSPLAVLYVHGCHPTALGHDNLAYSADWPWAAARALEDAFPGVNPIFVLGAHADVDPRTRGIQDLAVEGQSVGVGFDAVEALGREIGEAVAEAVREIVPAEAPRVGAASVRVAVETHPEREEERREALRALGLPEDSKAGTGELYRLEHERTAGLPVEERRERIARVRRYLRGHTARRFTGSERPEVELQVLRLGEALLLALPVEPTVEVGLEWKARSGSGRAAVVGIANGWLRYLPHASNYEVPLAHQHYEVLQAALAPEAAEALLEAGLRLARQLDASRVEGPAA